MYDEIPSDWSCLSSCARKDIVVVIIMIVVGVEVGVGVVVVVRARTRIAHLQYKRPARWFRGHRWSYENTSDRCSTVSHVSRSQTRATGLVCRRVRARI
jgi:hypothetical protein